MDRNRSRRTNPLSHGRLHRGYITALAVAVLGITLAQPTAGGVLRAATVTNPPTFDVMTTATTSTRIVAAHVLESLVTYSEEFDIIPMLATGWDIAPDHRAYTFFLREGVPFHNGEFMTASDVKASHERFFELSTRRGRFANVQTISTPDDHTVVFELAEPDATFLAALASTFSWAVVMPRSVIERLATSDFEAADLVGTGPYEFVTWRPDVHVHLRRFEDYAADESREASGLGGHKVAYFDEVYIEIVPEQGARVAGLLTGDYDYAAELPATQLARFEADTDLSVVVVTPGTMPRLEFNHANEWSRELAFRQAIQAALDLEEILEAVTGGNSALYDLNPALMFRQQVWWSDVGTELYNQRNQERARELLDSIGYAGEEIVMLSTRDYEDFFRVTLVAADQLQQAGMNVVLRVMDWPGLRAYESRDTDWHVSITAGSIRFDPSDWDGTFHSTARRKFYANADMDQALERGRSTADFAERYANLETVQRVFYDTVNAVKIGDVFTIEGTRSDLKGYRPWDFSRFWGVWRD